MSQKTLVTSIGVVLLVATVLGWFFFLNSRTGLVSARQELASTTGELQLALSDLENEKNEKQQLNDELRDQRKQMDDLENQIEDLTGTVGSLEKLSKTDPELLEKYSKIFFLNENYVPAKLSYISSNYILAGREKQQIHRDVERYMEDLIDDADDENITLKIVSAYRSFGTQSTLKAGYTVTYGSGANAFSADQGYSEHQLGTTIDITAPEENAPFVAFENTDAYKWLQDNAYRYGFVLSYPQGNAYYQFEPWHWRFVGRDLARYLHKKKLNFYDMDQREIDTYLINFFD